MSSCHRPDARKYVAIYLAQSQILKDHRKACASQGKSYTKFLRELLRFFSEAYDRDPRMKARDLRLFVACFPT